MNVNRMLAAFLGCALLTLNAPSVVRADENPVIRLGMVPVESEAGAYYAQDMGYFRKAGIMVNIEHLANGPAITAAMSAGQLDIGAANPLSLANAFLRGIPIKVIAAGSLYSTRSPQSLLVVAPASPIRTAAELNGKTLCGAAVGGMDQLAMSTWMDLTGGSSATVKFIEVPSSVIPDALDQGRVDACVVAEPGLTPAIAAKRVRVLAPVYSAAYGERFTLAVFFGSNEWLANNPGVAKKFIGALVEGSVWGSKHPEQAAVILEKYSKVHLTRVQMIAPRTVEPFMIQPILDAGAKYKVLPRVMDAKEFLWSGR